MALTETTATGVDSDATTGSDDGISIINEAPTLPIPKMRVRKRDGSFEPVDPMKIVARIQRCAEGLDGVDPMRVATRTISGLHDGATTIELDELALAPRPLTSSKSPTTRSSPVACSPPTSTKSYATRTSRSSPSRSLLVAWSV